MKIPDILANIGYFSVICVRFSIKKVRNSKVPKKFSLSFSLID